MLGKPAVDTVASSAAAYRYDGSLVGFYACVFESYVRREMPANIVAEGDTAEQLSLLGARWIPSDGARALRVRAGLRRAGGARALELVETVFLSCMERREMALLRLVRRIFAEGPGVLDRLADPLVDSVLKAERHLRGEAHLLCGFVRFAESEGRLAATIGPKNFVLPLLAPHFSDRFPEEAFLIYDETHGAALLHEPGKAARIVQMERPVAPAVSMAEAMTQALWKQFYATIAIVERENPNLRRRHLPKRYWKYMTEMEGLL